MIWRTVSRRILGLIRVVVGGVFLYAGLTKVLAPRAFADSIASFQLLPDAWIDLMALSLPLFEMLAGALLIAGWRKRAAAFSVLVLTGVFLLALGQGLARGLEVDCGCFGSGPPSAWKTWAALGRDAALMAATWLIYRDTLQRDAETAC